MDQSRYNPVYICDVLRDLVRFVLFKKREEHPWRSVTLVPQLDCPNNKSFEFNQNHFLRIKTKLSPKIKAMTRLRINL